MWTMGDTITTEDTTTQLSAMATLPQEDIKFQLAEDTLLLEDIKLQVVEGILHLDLKKKWFKTESWNGGRNCVTPGE